MPNTTELIAQMALDRGTVAGKLDGTYTNARARNLGIFNAILEIEIASGSTFMVAKPEGTPYISIGLTHETFIIPRAGKGGDRFWAYLHRRYGIAERENITKYILDNLRSYALQNGTIVDVRRFAVYRAATQTAYMSSYNGSMWRFDGENVMTVANGEDDVFFVDDDGGVNVEPIVGPNNVLIEKIVNQLSFADTGMGGISPEQMRMAFIVWMFGLALPDLMPTKPLLIIEGAPGSGKSSAAQLLQTALLGDSKPMILSRNKEDDFGVLLLRSPIAVFDNLDSYIDWLPDAICAYTTKGTWTKRKFYTDAEELTIKPHAFIAVATKNPSSFRREDTADRCVILRLERRREFKRREALEQEVLTLRPQIVGEYLWYLNRLIAEIRAGVLAENETEAHRMADFAALARAVGRIMDWSDEEVAAMLVAIQSEQIAFINEEDPLVDLLHKWITYRPKNGPSNIGREVGLFGLFQELETVSEAHGIPFYKSARILVQKLRSPHIERDFIVQMLVNDGQKSYRIWRRTDGRLSSVPMSVAAVVEGADSEDG